MPLQISKLLSAIVLTAFASAAGAQAGYPNRPIRLIVPLGAGGTSDTVARVIAAALSERLRQSVIVENKPGAEGIIGVDAAAKAAPDGYTLVLGSSTTMAANVHLRKQLPFNPVKDLAPVAMAVVTFANVFVVNPGVPASNLQEFIAFAKSKPGRLDYGTGSSGSKICVEMLKARAGIDITMINYKSTPPAIIDLIGGQIQLVCEPLFSALPHIARGQLKALAVTSLQRVSVLPNTPTVAESGFPGYEYNAWVGIFAPAGTPAAVIKRLGDEIEAIQKNPETVRQIQKTGFDPLIGGADKLAELLRSEIVRSGAVVKAAGLVPE